MKTGLLWLSVMLLCLCFTLSITSYLHTNKQKKVLEKRIEDMRAHVDSCDERNFHNQNMINQYQRAYSIFFQRNPVAAQEFSIIMEQLDVE